MFDYDPIISEKVYPEVQSLYNLDLLTFNAKHFYIRDRDTLQQWDRKLYYLIAPHANLSLVSTVLTRDGLPYMLSPVGYTKSAEIYEYYSKLKLEVFTDIKDLQHAITGYIR